MRINNNLTLQKYNTKQINTQQKKVKFKEMLNSEMNNNSNSEDKLKKVSEEFESLFVGMMFKQMKKVGFKSNLIDTGMSKDIFEDMYYDELSKQAAHKTKLGIAEAVYEQLSSQVAQSKK